MKRREILKSAGCVLFLPTLESFGQNPSTPQEAKVKRLFCVSMGYGLFTDVLPQTDGADYAFSEHMEPLKKHRCFALEESHGAKYIWSSKAVPFCP